MRLEMDAAFLSMTPTSAETQERWGVLGGLGPLASTEFLKTVYELGAAQKEQQLPIIYLISDPSIPDRTQSLLQHNEASLAAALTDRLDTFVYLGIDKIVVCCMTIHAIFPHLSVDHRERIISLVDIALSELIRGEQSALLFATIGTRRSRLFESHRLWPLAKPFLVFPNEADQEQIHRLIYEIKSRQRTFDHGAAVIGLLQHYQVNAFIAGCTEIHVFAKTFLSSPPGESVGCVDPLMTLATRIVGAKQVSAVGTQPLNRGK